MSIKHACAQAHIITTEKLIAILDANGLEAETADFKGHFAGFKERYEADTVGNPETLNSYFNEFEKFLDIANVDFAVSVPESFLNGRNYDYSHFWSNTRARFNLFSADYTHGKQKKQKFVQTGFNIR